MAIKTIKKILFSSIFLLLVNFSNAVANRNIHSETLLARQEQESKLSVSLQKSSESLNSELKIELESFRKKISDLEVSNKASSDQLASLDKKVNTDNSKLIGDGFFSNISAYMTIVSVVIAVLALLAVIGSIMAYLYATIYPSLRESKQNLDIAVKRIEELSKIERQLDRQLWEILNFIANEYGVSLGTSAISRGAQLNFTLQRLTSTDESLIIASCESLISAMTGIERASGKVHAYVENLLRNNLIESPDCRVHIETLQKELLNIQICSHIVTSTQPLPPTSTP